MDTYFGINERQCVNVVVREKCQMRGNPYRKLNKLKLKLIELPNNVIVKRILNQLQKKQFPRQNIILHHKVFIE